MHNEFPDPLLQLQRLQKLQYQVSHLDSLDQKLACDQLQLAVKASDELCHQTLRSLTFGMAWHQMMRQPGTLHIPCHKVRKQMQVQFPIDQRQFQLQVS